MLLKELKYCYNDIAIVPSIASNVEHRGECNPYTYINGGASLPIFTAPMSTVVNEKNFSLFEREGIIPILPRNIYLKTRIEYLQMGKWVAVSKKEFEELFLDEDWDIEAYPDVNVLIDIANGHMTKLHEIVRKAKQKYPSYRFKIMAGNVANPETYKELAEAGCYACRLSIGTGEGCLTWTKLGVGYPIASLIDETYKVKKRLEQSGKITPLIIADGGVRETRHVMIALALGSDAVMVGGLLSKLVESAAPTFYYGTDGESIIEINPFEHDIVAKPNGTFTIDGDVTIDKLYKIFYGMASKRGQEDINGEKTKTSEGVEKVFDCTTNLHKWVENMKEYMQSAMSYTNCYFIEEFNPENVDCIIISQQTKESINK